MFREILTFKNYSSNLILIFTCVINCSVVLASQIETGMKDIGVYIDVNPHKEKKLSVETVASNSNNATCSSSSLINTDTLMEKSVLTPGFEKLDNVPKYSASKRQLKMERRKEADKTKGGKWFNLPATEMTEEKLRDLEIIQMRSILNPKQFYKKNDLKVVPKYFQVMKQNELIFILFRK